MTTLFQDIRYAIRILFKHKGVSLVAIVTLALGIGANTAIFSVVNGVILRPLPYREPDRLVALWEKVPTHGQWRAAPANFFDWKKQNTLFEGMAAYGGSAKTLTGVGDPEQLQGTRVSADYFTVVGVEPILGRSFLAEEYEVGKGQVVILGNELWHSRFGGDSTIIDRNITLDGSTFRVIGVMAPGIYPVRPTTTGHIEFDITQQQYWLPMSFTAEWAAVRGAHVLGVVGRLKSTITIEQAQAEMSTIGARLEQEYTANKGEGVIVSPFMNEMVGNVRPALITMLIAVGFVLLIACSNIAALLLAQHAARGKEIAIRAALGAGRSRLVRQFFVEGSLLALLGTAAGLGLAKIGTGLLLKLAPANIPRLDQVGIDLRVFAFAFGLCFVTCCLFGLIPAWQASKPDLHTTLEQSGRTSGAGAHRLRFRQCLVVFQVSIALLLVVGAGLVIKSFWRLQQVDPGFQAERVLSMGLTLPPGKYSKPDLINQFFSRLNDGLANLGGVETVAIAYDHPLQTNWVDSFEVEGRVASADKKSLSANFNSIGPDYFRTVGTQLVAGRSFAPVDDQDHPGVAIVNEAFARQYFPGEQALGQRIKAAPPARIWKNQKLTSFEIVGIVRDVRSSGLQSPGEPTYYIPASQAPLNDMKLLIRTTVEPAAMVAGVQKTIWAIDPNQPVSDVNTLDKLVDDDMAQPRLNMLLMGMFGSVALILASVGIYGLLSYAVTQRTREMGIRMALGARVGDVLSLVLRQGMVLALIGEVIGIGGALALTRLMRGLLFGVTPTDVTVFGLVVGVLTTTALLACYLPARRATKVDPLIALRSD